MKIRATLRDGKIATPRSVLAAREDLSRFQAEINRIDGQLADVTRVVSMGTVAYDDWKGRAIAARGLFREEVRQLEKWIAEQGVQEDLDFEAFWRE